MEVNYNEAVKNLSEIIDLAQKENVIIIKNGKPVAKLLGISQKDSVVSRLKGVIKVNDIDLKKEREERLLGKYESIR